MIWTQEQDTIGSAIWLHQVDRLPELLLLSTERYRSSDVARANLDTTCQQFANNECSYRMRRMNEGKTAATDEMHPMRGLRLGLRRASENARASTPVNAEPPVCPVLGATSLPRASSLE